METWISWQKDFKLRGIIIDNFIQCCCQAIQIRILLSESLRLVQFYQSSHEELAKTASKTNNPHDFITPDNSVNSIVSLWFSLWCEVQARHQMSLPFPTKWQHLPLSMFSSVGSYHNPSQYGQREAAFLGSGFDFLFNFHPGRKNLGRKGGISYFCNIICTTTPQNCVC